MTRIKDLPTFETLDPTNWVAVDSNDDLEPSGKASPATLAAFVNSDLSPLLSIVEGTGITVSGDPQNPTITADQGGGDMYTDIYDPQNISNDAFDLANHTGDLPPSSVNELTLTRRLSGRVGGLFDTVADLLADTTLTYSNVSPGDIIEAQGFRYEVAASGAAGNDIIENANEVKLRVRYQDALLLEQFGATEGQDCTEIFSKALNHLYDSGGGVLTTGLRSVNVTSTSEIPGIVVRPGVELRLPKSTDVTDLGNGETFVIRGTRAAFSGGLWGGRFITGGNAIAGIVIEDCREADVHPAEVVGRFSEAQYWIRATRDGRSLFNRVSGWVGTDASRPDPRTIVKITTDTLDGDPDTSFCNANFLDVTSFGATDYGVDITGSSSGNIIRGSYETRTTQGIAAIRIGDGTGVDGQRNNVIDYSRLEGWDTYVDVSETASGTQIFGFFAAIAIDDRGESTVVIAENDTTGRSPSGYKTITSGVVEVDADSSVEFFRINLPAGRRIYVGSGQCHNVSGNNALTWRVEIYRVQDNEVLASIGGVNYQRGFPIARRVVSGEGSTYAARLVNESGGVQRLYGSLSIIVDGE